MSNRPMEKPFLTSKSRRRSNSLIGSLSKSNNKSLTSVRPYHSPNPNNNDEDLSVGDLSEESEEILRRAESASIITSPTSCIRNLFGVKNNEVLNSVHNSFGDFSEDNNHFALPKQSLIKSLFGLSKDKLLGQIHDRYERYSNLTDSEKDHLKTGYTYSDSASYRVSNVLDHVKAWIWEVPNMSRRSVSRTLTHTSEFNSNTAFESESTRSRSSVSREQSFLTNASISPKKKDDSPFTRSQCLGGEFCTAGCLLHKKKRSNKKRSQATLIPHSGVGLEPEYSDGDDDTSSHISNNHYAYPKKNGHMINHRARSLNYQDDLSDDGEDEEITVVKRITNIFRTTIRNTHSVVDNATPGPLKGVSARFPLSWTLFWTLICLSLLIYFIYFLSQLYSSPHSTLTPSPILSSSAINQLKDSSVSSQALMKVVDELEALKSEIRIMQNEKIDAAKNVPQDEPDKHEHLYKRVLELEEQVSLLIKNCCKNDTQMMVKLIDERINSLIGSLSDDNADDKANSQFSIDQFGYFMRQIIREESSKMTSNEREQLESKITLALETMENQFSQKVEQKHERSTSSMSVEEVKRMIREALAIYDADKTGQPDYALEPAGGTVINTRCSETFDPYGIQYRIFGIPLWTTSISPRAVIQPTISPGECWAFRGAQGYLVIKLSQRIIPTAFSYEHIPKQISRDGNIESAPKEFQVRGLEDEKDTKGHVLGNYIYEDNGSPMQYFLVEDPHARPFEYIELATVSNHGHPEYTCLYRFRVHGKRVTSY